MNIESHIIYTEEDAVAAFEYIEQHDSPFMVLDIETDSTTEVLANTYGIGVCLDEEQGFYFVIRNKPAPEQAQGKQALSGEWVTKHLYRIAQTKKLIGHNISYDVNVLFNNYGVDLAPLIHADTILLKSLVDEERPFGLKETAVKYLGEGADLAQQEMLESIKANGGKTTKDSMEMFRADTNILGKYCVWDVVLTLKLFHIFNKALEKDNLVSLFYEEETMPLYKEVVIPMKRKGFRVDVPHFLNLKKEIELHISQIERDIQLEIGPLVEEYENKLLEEDFPEKRTGNFPKALARVWGVNLPGKDGKVSLSKKALEALDPHHGFTKWINEQGEAPQALIQQTRRLLFSEKHPEKQNVFNISSNEDLRYLFFTKLGIHPKETTETGEAKLSADILEEMAGDHPIADKIIDFKKLNKLLSTYIEGILDRQVKGVIYAGWLQWGTTSGRFSCTNPNLQNLPRVKDDEAGLSPLVLKYVNEIKRGFVGQEGHMLVNADFSQLEPCCFASVSGSKELQEVFHKKQDLYSAIAIQATGNTQYSADKKAANYLKNFKPELRQQYKVVALAVVYGASAFRIAGLLGIKPEQAQEIIDNYLNAYPDLKKYIHNCHYQVKKYGQVKTRFGRVRHLPEAIGLYKKYGDNLLDPRYVKRNNLGEIRYTFKNLLNLSTNHPIQGLAGHIANRAMIKVTREFQKHNIEGYVCAQVHDEVTCSVREDQAELAAKILKAAMETTTTIEVPLVAEPIVGSNWAEAK